MAKNPFAFYCAKVEGANFIGRKQELAELWERSVKNRAFTQVVGLPRMGKSSLIKQCFETKRSEAKLKKSKFIYVYTESIPRKAILFWKIFADKVYVILDEQYDPNGFTENSSVELAHTYSEVSVQKWSIIKKDYNSFKSESDIDLFHSKLCTWLNNISKTLGYRVLYVIDEFDGFARFNGYFDKIRELATFCSIVTVSRRPIKIIEENAGCKPYLFGLHEHPIYIGTFSDEDIDEYWKHYGPKLKLSAEDLSSYKLLVADYVGSHPNLMNYINHEAFTNISNLMSKDVSTRRTIEYSLRVAIVSMFEKQMQYLEEQNLSEAAKQLLIGSEWENLMSESTLLTRYTFIRLMARAEKHRIFNADIGPIFIDGNKSYACFSNFATYLFYDIYSNKLPYAERLKNTELKLRAIIKDILCKQLHDSSALSVLSDDYFGDDHYEEKWESTYRRSLKCYGPVLDAWENTLQEAKDHRYNELSYEYAKAPDHRCLIDFMSIGQLWHLFFSKNWNWFQPVFNESKSAWKNDRFDKVKDLRNAKDHYQVDFVSNDIKENGLSACDDICQKIDSYFEHHR